MVLVPDLAVPRVYPLEFRGTYQTLRSEGGGGLGLGERSTEQVVVAVVELQELV